MIRKQFLIKGKVQGVGFRFFCQMTAVTLENLTGFAKNLDNGDVLVEIQGPYEKVVEFRYLICKGNRFCKVTDIIEKELSLINKEKKFFVK